MLDIDGRPDGFTKLNLIDLPKFRDLRKSRNILVIDTETADGWKLKTLAQVGYVVKNTSGDVLETMDEYVYGAKCIEWEDSKLDLNMIRQGMPKELVRDRLYRSLCRWNPIIVAHNVSFDIPILQKQLGIDFGHRPIFCTCRDIHIKNICRLPLKNSKKCFKSPKQDELATHCNVPFDDLVLHTAYDDVLLLTRILDHPMFF